MQISIATAVCAFNLRTLKLDTDISFIHYMVQLLLDYSLHEFFYINMDNITW